MGCFNATCLVSGLPITYEDQVVYFPLIPSERRGDKMGTIEIKATRMIVNGNDQCELYSPLTLPFFGKYNDYGSLEDIKRDANVLAFEEYFGITIDQFFAIRNGQYSSIYNSDDGWMDAFGEDKKAFAGSGITVEWLEGLGFTCIETKKGIKITHPKSSFYYINPKKRERYDAFPRKKASMELKEGVKEYAKFYFLMKNKVQLMVLNTETLKYKEVGFAIDCNDYDARKKFGELFTQKSGSKGFYGVDEWYLNISKENQKHIHLLRQLSGCFVLKEVYDKLIAYSKSCYPDIYEGLMQLGAFSFALGFGNFCFGVIGPFIVSISNEE